MRYTLPHLGGKCEVEGGASKEGIEKKNREREGPLSETTAEMRDTYFFRGTH